MNGDGENSSLSEEYSHSNDFWRKTVGSFMKFRFGDENTRLLYFLILYASANVLSIRSATIIDVSVKGNRCALTWNICRSGLISLGFASYFYLSDNDGSRVRDKTFINSLPGDAFRENAPRIFPFLHAEISDVIVAINTRCV